MTSVQAPRSAASSPVPPSETEGELAARLRLAIVRLARLLRSQGDGEVTASQLSALSSLERRGPLTLGELSAVERVKPPTMTRVVASLEEMGLVTRTVGEVDRRVARVEATEAGRQLLARSRNRKDAFLAARLRSLPPDDRIALRRAADALDRLLDGPR